MFRTVFIMLAFFAFSGFTKAQITASQLVGKYWLYLKDTNLKTEEFFEIKPGEGQSYEFVWPDHSTCKLIPEGPNSYHLECKDEKLQVTFDAEGAKVKGFTLYLANDKMYGLKSE